MPDQRFPAQFSCITMNNEDRFLRIIQNGCFPKRLSLKVLETKLQTPYRNLFGDEPVPSTRPHVSQEGEKVELESNNKPSQLNLSAKGATEASEKSRELDDMPVQHSMEREKTFYPYGWPRSKTKVKLLLKQAKLGLFAQTEKASSKQIENPSGTWENTSENENIHVPNTVNERTLHGDLKYCSMNTFGSFSSVSSAGSRAGEVASARLVNLDLNGRNTGFNTRDRTQYGVGRDWPSADISGRVNWAYKPGEMQPVENGSFQSFVTPDEPSRQQFDESGNVMSVSNKLVLPPIAADNSTKPDSETVSHRQQTISKVQTKLPALHTKGKQYKGNLSTDSPLRRESDSTGAQRASLPLVEKRKQRKKYRKRKSKEMLDRKPVLSSVCQLKDLIQVDRFSEMKAVDPYAVYIKYHGNKQVIDSSSYYRHARRALPIGISRSVESPDF